MIKSFSGQVVFCFAILRAISAYVGENWLSQYTSDLKTSWSHDVKNLPKTHYRMTRLICVLVHIRIKGEGGSVELV